MLRHMNSEASDSTLKVKMTYDFLSLYKMRLVLRKKDLNYRFKII